MVNEFGLVNRGHDIYNCSRRGEGGYGAGYIVASKYAAKGEAVDVGCRLCVVKRTKRKKFFRISEIGHYNVEII
jgi:hypothetical protein